MNPVDLRTGERSVLVISWVRSQRTFHVLCGGRCLCGVRIPPAGPSGWPGTVVRLEIYLAGTPDGAAWDDDVHRGDRRGAMMFTGETVWACRRCRDGLLRGLQGVTVWAVRSARAFTDGRRYVLARGIHERHPRLTWDQAKAIAERRMQESDVPGAPGRCG